MGNGAYNQKQHDVWGASTRSTCTPSRATTCPRSCGRSSSARSRRRIEHWREPDRGIWEVRGEPKHFTSSKLMCWVAADRGARLARLREDVENGRALAGRRRRDPRRHLRARRRRARRVHPALRNRCPGRLGCCSCPCVRFLPADDERVRATVLAIDEELTVDGMVLRYRTEETDDGLSGEEGTFTICSFWLVSALAEIGEIRQGAPAVRAAARLRQPARALRRGDRPAQRPAPGQLPPGVLPPGADQRGDARHPRRPRARRGPRHAGRGRGADRGRRARARGGDRGGRRGRAGPAATDGARRRPVRAPPTRDDARDGET